MRLHVLSDLHLEHEPFAAPTVDADIVVLAGDIGLGTKGVLWAREWAGDRPVLYLAGNHEFYGFSLPGLIDDLRAAAAGSQVHVLENDELIVGGVRFLGCTLWSDFEFDGPDNLARSMTICERLVNDYKQIRLGPDQRNLTAVDTRAAHLASRQWLAARLAEPHDGDTVVLTHHAPVIRVRPDTPVLRAIAGAFASDVTGLMGAERVPLWIYGHTHRTADLDINGTRVFSNPRGYPHQPVDGFDPACVIELPDSR